MASMTTALPAAVPGSNSTLLPAPRRADQVTVAAIATEYRSWSHADVILGRVIKGYRLDVEPHFSPVRVRAMYIEQMPKTDIGRAIGVSHNIPIVKSIRDAILDDHGRVAVDGVLLIGEHGRYPYNEREQHLYPRRRFFEETVAAFQEAGTVVPVFNDKHLDARWENTKFMYETAKEMNIPFMAGSSVPLAWRHPWMEIPIGAPLTEAVGVGYGGIEAYGFHALENIQCNIERRAGGESGVRAVQCLTGEAVWEAMHAGRFSRKLLAAALSRNATPVPDDFEKQVPNPTAFLVEHVDGFKSTCVMFRNYVSDFLFATEIEGYSEPLSMNAWLQEPRWGHFSYLTNAILRMVLTGRPQYPVERTVITSGIISTAMDSRYEDNRLIETPDMHIAYQPTDNNLAAHRHPDSANGRSGGWLELFNGQDIDNWLVRDYADDPLWTVEDGVLTGQGGKGYIATTEEFDDFELFAELRIDDVGDRRGNSGIHFRCQRHEDLAVEYPRGYELQCDHNDRGNPTGTVYGLHPTAPRTDIQDGEWFTLRLKAVGKRLQTWVNGASAVDIVDSTLRYRSGNILVQAHHTSAVVQIRELRVRRV